MPLERGVKSKEELKAQVGRDRWRERGKRRERENVRKGK